MIPETINAMYRLAGSVAVRDFQALIKLAGALDVIQAVPGNTRHQVIIPTVLRPRCARGERI